MKISIIIPVYNAEKTLQKSVNSLLRQKDVEKEIILIDDWSSDNSYELCKELERKHDCITAFRTTGKGVATARNVGIEYATGDVIGFCDADDYYEPNSLNLVKNTFEKNEDVSIIVGGYRVVTLVEGNELKKEEKALPKDIVCSGEQLMYYILNDNRIFGAVWNKFFRRELLKTEAFDKTLSYCEDVHFNIGVCFRNNCVKAMIIKDVLYNYVNNSKSATNSSVKLWEENGTLKYITALDTIIREFGIDKKIISCVSYKKFIISVDVFYGMQTTEEQGKYLLKICQENFKYFLQNFFLINTRENMRYLIKYLVRNRK